MPSAIRNESPWGRKAESRNGVSKGFCAGDGPLRQRWVFARGPFGASTLARWTRRRRRASGCPRRYNPRIAPCASTEVFYGPVAARERGFYRRYALSLCPDTDVLFDPRCLLDTRGGS